jgi:hypothetical protein
VGGERVQRVQRPIRTLWSAPWDVRHLGRDQRPTVTREGLGWGVKHTPSVAPSGAWTKGPSTTHGRSPSRRQQPILDPRQLADRLLQQRMLGLEGSTLEDRRQRSRPPLPDHPQPLIEDGQQVHAAGFPGSGMPGPADDEVLHAQACCRPGWQTRPAAERRETAQTPTAICPARSILHNLDCLYYLCAPTGSRRRLHPCSRSHPSRRAASRRLRSAHSAQTLSGTTPARISHPNSLHPTQ